MKINQLAPSVYNRISAGEVVERPASIVKELVENSIDAGATSIKVEIEAGGIKNITVSDNGCGIEKDDLTVAFLPHATSKIKTESDLDSIESLGFRGEALASIASVCQVKMSSKTEESAIGYSLSVNGGEFGKVEEIARTTGTTMSCSNLFYNTPVRAKFLRKPKTEEAEVTHLIEKFMLSNSNIAFQYYVDGKQIYNTTSCSMQDIIYTIYGKEVYDNLVEVRYEEDGFLIYGFVTKPKISKSNRSAQTIFVNGRTVENHIVSSSANGVFESFLMKGRFPMFVLSIKLPPNCVDVNMHPSKKEVKFDNPNKMFSMVRKAVEKALYSIDQIQNFIVPQDLEEEKPNIKTSSQTENSISINLHQPRENEPIEQLQEVRPQMNGGKSFSVDLFDREEKLIDIKINEVEVASEKEEDKKDFSSFKNLENLSIKTNDNPQTTFFFDQSGEKFTREIEKSVEQKFLNASVKDEMKILGTIFKTYIVAEYDDAVYFIDQHAGHERLLYDKLVESINKNNVTKQQLLVPYSFSVGAKESQSIDMLLEGLEKIGFDIIKDNYSYQISSVPYLLSFIDLSKFADELVSEGINLEKKASDFIHEKLCQTACKHAIKAGDTISKDDCAYLIEQVRKGVMLCPHGRPITLVLSKRDFEKMFKRIV